MKRLIYYIIAGTMSCLFPDEIFSQEIVSSGGGNTQSSTGMISYTLGELVISTASASSKTLTQGFHQSKITITKTFEAEGNNITITAFPNPASSMIVLKIAGEMPDAEYKIIDTNGKIHQVGKVTGNRTEISLDQLSPSIYFLKVIKKGKDLKIFRVAKQ